MIPKSILLSLATLAVLSFAHGGPNIVVIMTDDQGWGDLSLHGNTGLSTPNIDRLAREGAAFDRFFVSPVCSPTRAEFLTGRYHPRCGISRTTQGGERLDLDEETIAQVLKAAGYRTALFGKWHHGTQHPYHPNNRGFEEFYGFTSGHLGNYYDSQFLDHNGEVVRGQGYLTDDLTERAMAYIGRTVADQKPFFVYLAYNTPHSPMQVPERFWRRFAEKKIELRGSTGAQENVPHTRAALAMCENIDWNVGRLLQKLDAVGARDDTIVVFLGDNGPDEWRWNGGMKGRKGSTDEGGVRSPLFIRWPRIIKAGVALPSIGHVIDLRPTLTDLIGLNDRAAQPLDGISLKSALLHGKAPAGNRTVFSHWNGKVSARTQQYRLDADGALFDMNADPNQLTDIARTEPEIARRLQREVETWRTDVLSELVVPDNRAFVICHPAAPTTQLPARDASLHGNIKRSNRFPNSSYITNWTSTNDSLSWNVSVGEHGLYEATVYYACAEGDVGTMLELGFGGSRVRQRVQVAHNPPLIGAAGDVLPRYVSYEKEWRPLALGRIDLQKTDGTLVLKAIEIPGKEAIEFRLLVLRKAKLQSE